MILFIPAVDIKSGKVVRLLRGQCDQETCYSEDPLSTIRKFTDTGAVKFLHIVDLDGAIDNKPQLKVLESLKGNISVDFQWAGGVRTLDYLEHVIKCGAKKVVVSSAVLLDPSFLEQALSRFGSDKLAVSVDALEDKIAIKGWQDMSGISLKGFISWLTKKGCKNIIMTDITRDGTMEGARISFFKDAIEKIDANFILAGGISSYDDLIKIKGLNLSNIKGIICGKALYEQKIDPAKAQEILSSDE